jgi:uncharacterized protein DUF4266
MRAVAIVLLLATVSACRIVPKNRRQHLADPTMQPDEDVLRDRAHAKIHQAREGAAGGDGEPAGGGCGCGN